MKEKGSKLSAENEVAASKSLANIVTTYSPSHQSHAISKASSKEEVVIEINVARMKN